MKQSILILVFVCAIFNAVYSQDFSQKYGKITNYELEMKSYSHDTSAVAVVLYDNGFTAYDYVNNRFEIYNDYKKKIKILKHDGVNEATFHIDLYDKGYGSRESVSDLEAISYNLENGKVVKSKLDRKYIFEEELSKNYKRMKFSVPNVKVGSVVEVKFRKKSDLYYKIDTWMFQSHLPVVSSLYQVRIPEYFVFNFETKGYETVDVKEAPQSQSFTIMNSGNSNVVSCISRDLKFMAENLPAIKNESFVWSAHEYMSAVRFELKATNFPYDFYKPYSQTWDDLEKLLKTDTDFGSNLRMSNPYKSEIKELIKNLTDDKQKVEAIYMFVKSKIRWDEKYSFWGNNARDAAKDGVGNNGQINMVLLSALGDAGIAAYPVLLSRRSVGRLPYSFPSLEKLNTFIVAVKLGDGKICYLDGSTEFGGLNVLPLDFLVDRARVFCDTVAEKWVDLTALGKNQKLMMVNAILDVDGKIKSTVSKVFSNQCALDYYIEYKNSKDSASYVEGIETSNKIEISNFSVNLNETMKGMVKEEFEFNKQLEMAGDMIYINPMIFAHVETNNFTQSDRKLPVEFNYPYLFLLSTNITIPENFEVAEIPKSMKILLNDKCRITYSVKYNEGVVSLVYRFEFNQIIFPNTEYENIRDFFAAVVNKNQEMLVLKRIKS